MQVACASMRTMTSRRCVVARGPVHCGSAMLVQKRGLRRGRRRALTQVPAGYWMPLRCTIHALSLHSVQLGP